MKRFLVAAGLLLVAAAGLADTTTSRIPLVQPTIGSAGWGTKTNNNWAVVASSAAGQYVSNLFTSTNTFTGYVALSSASFLMSGTSNNMSLFGVTVFDAGGSTFHGVMTGDASGIMTGAWNFQNTVAIQGILTESVGATFGGSVAIGTTTVAGSTLTVNGMIRSLSGGYKFPDGSVQTTAASGGLSGTGSATQIPVWTGAGSLSYGQALATTSSATLSLSTVPDDGWFSTASGSLFVKAGDIVDAVDGNQATGAGITARGFLISDPTSDGSLTLSGLNWTAGGSGFPIPGGNVNIFGGAGVEGGNSGSIIMEEPAADGSFVHITSSGVFVNAASNDGGGVFTLNAQGVIPIKTPVGVQVQNGGFVSAEGGFFSNGVAAASVSQMGYTTRASSMTFSDFGTSGQFANVTSLPSVQGQVSLTGCVAASLNGSVMTDYEVAVSTFSGNTTTDHVETLNWIESSAFPISGANETLCVSNYVIDLGASPTTVYLKAKAAYSVATPQHVGTLRYTRLN